MPDGARRPLLCAERWQDGQASPSRSAQEKDLRSGVSSGAIGSTARTAQVDHSDGGRTRTRYFLSTAEASSERRRVWDRRSRAITAGSSPGTSDIASITTRAGAQARQAPPLIAERCLRTQLISAIVAPLRNSAAATVCLRRA